MRLRIPARPIRADPRPRAVERAARPPARGAGRSRCLSRQDIVSSKPRLAVRNVGEFSRRLAVSVGVFFAAFWIAHLFRRWRRRDDDPLLLPALLLLCGIGLMTMTALRDPIRDTIAAELFAAGAAMGIVLLVAASEVDFEASRAAARRAAAARPGLRAGGAAAALRQRPGLERRKSQPARRAAGRSDPPAGGVRAGRVLRPPRRTAARAVGARDRLAAMAARRAAAALARRAAGDRRHGHWCCSFFFFQKDLGPALVLSCVFLGLLGVARGQAGSGRDRPRAAAGRLRRRVLDRRAADGRQPRDDVVRSLEQRRAGRNSRRARPVGAVDRRRSGAAVPASAAPARFPRVTPTSSSAAIGEELGWIGFAAVVALYAFSVLARACGSRTGPRVTSRRSSPSASSLVLGVQALVIAGGLSVSSRFPAW